MLKFITTLGIIFLMTACAGTVDLVERPDIFADRVTDTAAVDSSAGHDGDQGAE